MPSIRGISSVSKRIQMLFKRINQVSVDVALAILLGVVMGGPAVLMVYLK